MKIKKKKSNYFGIISSPLLSRLSGNEGVQCGDVAILYKMIWQDVRGAMDWVHNSVSL